MAPIKIFNQVEREERMIPTNHVCIPTNHVCSSESELSTLLCCPFCGSEATAINDWGDLMNGGNREPKVKVGCASCEIFTRCRETRIKNEKGLYFHSDEPTKEAAKIWNLRT